MSETKNANDEQECAKHDFGEPYKTKVTQESARIVMEQAVVVRACKKCGETKQLDVTASNHDSITDKEHSLKDERPQDNVRDAILVSPNDTENQQTQSQQTTDDETVTEQEERFVTETTKPSQSQSARVLVCDACTKGFVYDETEILNEYDTCPDCERGKLHLFQET